MVLNVLFVSVRNAGRTHMATAWFNALAHPAKARAVSAGTQPAQAIDAEVAGAMRQVGFDLSSAAPQLLTPVLEGAADLIITVAPMLLEPPVHGPGEHDVWLVDDPEGENAEYVRRVRDDVEKLVRRLLVARHWTPFGASTPPTSP